MITYELAKKLKDAGFPQSMEIDTHWYLDDGSKSEATFFPVIGSLDVNDSMMTIYREITDRAEENNKSGGTIDFSKTDNKIVFVPTLSEIIEACGDKFEGLIKREDDWIACKYLGAYGGDYPYLDWEGEKGSTAEIAVANLYLALNKK